MTERGACKDGYGRPALDGYPVSAGEVRSETKSDIERKCLYRGRSAARMSSIDTPAGHAFISRL
jgi:hypothetical protein